jgi:hypothetical protein
MLVEKNLKALVYFAKYQWRRQNEIRPEDWTPEEMAWIKSIMQQVKAAKADQIGDNIDPGQSMSVPVIMIGWDGSAINCDQRSEQLTFRLFMLFDRHMMMTMNGNRTPITHVRDAP